MNNIFKRVLSLLLVLVMCISFVSASALAEDEVETEVTLENIAASHNEEEAPIPSPTSTPEVVEVPDIPVITKHPTSESTSVGGSLQFTAHADNAPSVQWFIVSADGNSTISADGASDSYPGITVTGCYEDTLAIDNATAELNRCSVYAVFTSSTGEQVKTTEASIDVTSTTTIVASDTCGVDGDNLTWTLDSDGMLTISGTGKMADYSSQNQPWYSNRSSIKSVKIGDSVTSIGSCAFYECTSLTSVVIGDSVTSIENHAFHSCTSLTSIEIPDSVTNMDYSVFYSCTSLISVKIGDSVTNIGSSVFKYCSSLASVVIGASVTGIGNYAFSSCTSLTSVEIGVNVTSIGDEAFSGCYNLATVTILGSVTDIGERIITNSSCTIILPYGNELYTYAYCKEKFGTCACVSFAEDGSVHGFCGPNAYWKVKGTELTISGNGKMDDFGDYHSNYTSNNYVYGYYEYDENPPWKNYMDGVENVVIDGVSNIGGGAFADTEIENVSIGQSVESIGDYAFGECENLLTIDLPSSIDKIGEAAFEDCGIINLNLKESIQEIGKSAFTRCYSLKKVQLPDNLTVIADYTFGGCTQLAEINLGSVTSIGAYSFQGCRLSVIDIGNAQILGEGAFRNCSYARKIILSNELSSIPNGCFCNSRLVTIELPDTVESIGDSAFSSCSSLQAINLPENLKTIGQEAFSGCSSLYRIDIPSSVSKIEQKTFQNCTNLTVANIPSTVTTIKTAAFDGCSKLTIYGTKGSKAETYADANDIPFSTTDKLPPELTGIELSIYSVTLTTDKYGNYESVEYSITAVPANAPLGKVSVSSSDESVVYSYWEKVNDSLATGRLWRNGDTTGKATITVSAGGYSKEIQVTIPAVLTGISMISTLQMETDSMTTLTVSPNPSGAEIGDVKWSSSNASVVSVTPSGDGSDTAVLESGSKAGTAKITATASGKSVTCTVTVEAPRVTYIELKDANGDFINDTVVNCVYKKGTKLSFTAAKYPVKASSSLKWFSSNAKVATVSNGVVTLTGTGETVISAKSQDSMGTVEYFTINAADLTPVLSSKTITINSYLTSGTEFTVTAANGSSVTDVAVVKKSGNSYVGLDKIILTDVGNSTYEARYNGVGKASYSAYAKVTVSSEFTATDEIYYVPVKISVVNTAPVPSISIEKINTYYPDNSFAVTATAKNGVIAYYELAEGSNEHFELDGDGNIIFSDSGKAVFGANPKAKSSNPIIFNVYFEGSDKAVTKSVKPSVTYSQPTVKLGSLKFNSFYTSDRMYDIPLTVKNGTVDYVELADNSSGYFGLEDGKLFMDKSAYQSGVKFTDKIVLNVYLKNCDTPYTVSAKPSVTKSKPSVCMKTVDGTALSSITYNSFFGDDTAQIVLFDKTANTPVNLSEVSVTLAENAFKTAIDDSENGIISLTYGPDDGKTYSKTSVEISSSLWNNSITYGISVKHGVEPAVSLSTKGKIDLIQRNSSGIKITPKISKVSDASVIDMEILSITDAKGNECINLFAFEYSSSECTAMLKASDGQNVTKGSYNAIIGTTVICRGYSETKQNTIKFTPTQSKLSIKSAKTTMYFGDETEVFLSITPAAAELESLDAVTSTIPSGMTIETDAAGGKITVKTSDEIKSGSYTITLKASAKGAVSGTAETTVKMVVVVKYIDYIIY